MVITLVNMGCCLEMYWIVEVREKQTIGMVHMHIHIQYSRNLADNIFGFLSEK
jgi:hypothetical protein